MERNEHLAMMQLRDFYDCVEQENVEIRELADSYKYYKDTEIGEKLGIALYKYFDQSTPANEKFDDLLFNICIEHLTFLEKL